MLRGSGERIAVLHVGDDPQRLAGTQAILERETENVSVVPETSAAAGHARLAALPRTLHPPLRTPYPLPRTLHPDRIGCRTRCRYGLRPWSTSRPA